MLHPTHVGGGAACRMTCRYKWRSMKFKQEGWSVSALQSKKEFLLKNSALVSIAIIKLIFWLVIPAKFVGRLSSLRIAENPT